MLHYTQILAKRKPDDSCAEVLRGKVGYLLYVDRQLGTCLSLPPYSSARMREGRLFPGNRVDEGDGVGGSMLFASPNRFTINLDVSVRSCRGSSAAHLANFLAGGNILSLRNSSHAHVTIHREPPVPMVDLDANATPSGLINKLHSASSHRPEGTSCCWARGKRPRNIP